MPDLFGGNELDRTPWPGEVPPPEDVPPPPAEVNVRTMESDLKAMAQSGGGVPEFTATAPVPKPIVIAGDTVKPDVSYAEYIWFGLGLLVVGIFIALGYYYFFYLKESPVALPITMQPKSTSSIGTIPSTPGTPVLAVAHTSFFTTPAEQTLTYTVGAAISDATDLQTYGQKMIGVLASSTNSFFEVQTQDAGGAYLSLSKFISFLNTPVLDQNFLNKNFSADYTYFIYKDQNGYWPGYVLQLKPGQDARFLTDDIAKIESSPYVGNLFLTPPGSPDPAFRDALVDAQPVREIRYSSGAVFVYGWFGGNNYLILSTSESGLKGAERRL